MRRAWMIVLVGTLVLTACGGDSGDSATDNPTSATTTGHDHGGSATCSPSTSLSVVAQNTTFSTDCLAAPAGQQFTLTLDNKDNGLQHSVAILASHESSQIFASTGIFPGVATRTITVTPDRLPGPGTYHFHCEVHPSLMMGTFIVK